MARLSHELGYRITKIIMAYITTIMFYVIGTVYLHEKGYLELRDVVNVINNAFLLVMFALQTWIITLEVVTVLKKQHS